MRIPDIYANGRFGLSIEIFPPRTKKGDESLRATLERLAVFRPAFISCTYGAGGTTRDRTLDWCMHVQKHRKVTATAHFTCVGATCGEMRNWLQNAWDVGVRNIMALRGDPPDGAAIFQPVDGGLRYASELVELIRSEYPDFGIGVAGYPEKHQECACPDEDLANLKRKVDAGADAVFTQLFYSNENFFSFRERFEKIGITIPLIPGIMPITEYARIQRITSMCGAVFPRELSERLEAVKDDKAAQFEIGVEYAIDQCRELLNNGVPGIHFYVLNRSQACERILNELGFKPAQAECA